MNKIFDKRALPWWLAAIFAAAFLALFIARPHGGTPTTNGVVQDNSGRRVLYWADPMIAQGPPHNYTSNKPGFAPDCHMKLVPIYADEAGRPGAGAVAISPSRQQLIGVKLATAESRDLSRTIRTLGRVTVDERRMAQIHTKFDGVIEQLFVNYTGEAVRRGQPLLAIYSPDLLSTQQELLLAAANKTDFGRTLYEAARRRLLLWDMSAGDIDAVVRSGKAVRSVIIRSPVDGVVLNKTAVVGARVMPADTLYQIADLRTVWILADVYESEVPYVRVGDTAQIAVSAAPGQSWIGRVTFVSPVLDETTRTAKVRIEMANAGGLLKPDMYAEVLLRQRIGTVVAVPDSAVIQTGTRSIVFVQRAPGEFEARQVVTGAKAEGYYDIRQGVRPGEIVVVDANFLVDSESRLKSVMSQLGGKPSPHSAHGGATP
jgi:membrane fusion protein, copper/silver efflux system